MPRPADPDHGATGALADDVADERAGAHLHLLPRPLRGAVDAIAARLGPWAGLLLTLAIGIAVVGLALDAFEDLWEQVRAATGTVELDHRVNAAVVDLRAPALTVAFTIVTEAAGKIGMPIIGIGLAAGLALAGRTRRPLVLIAIAGLGSLLLTTISKTAAGRERPPRESMLPPYETSPSFPSGHTLNATAILLVVAYCCLLQLDRLATRILAVAACLAFVVAVAASRIYLGAHWLSDVGGALALGAAWATVVIVGHRVLGIARKRQRERAAA